jgi:hypothetical protein
VGAKLNRWREGVLLGILYRVGAASRSVEGDQC